MPANYELWQPWEDEFVKEVYPLREWSIPQIAEKLERTPRAIEARAASLGVQRPKTLDYDAIARLIRQGATNARIARQLGCTNQGVRYARKRIAEVEHG